VIFLTIPLPLAHSIPCFKDCFYTEARRDRLAEPPATTRVFAGTVPTDGPGNVARLL
jgi:hypothetical protein